LSKANLHFYHGQACETRLHSSPRPVERGTINEACADTQLGNPNRFLVTVDVSKKWAVLKLDRGELEIIAVRPLAVKIIRKMLLK
jgi:hypothetical protein